RGGGREPDARAIRIDRRAFLAAQPRYRVEPELRLDRARVQHRRVDVRLAPRFLIALEPHHLLRRQRHRHRSALLEIALDIEPPQQRREIERRAPPRLPRVAREAQADRLLEIAKRDARIFRNLARRTRRRASAYLIG